MPAKLKEQFHEAMLNVHRRAKTECGYDAKAFLSMVNEHGGLATARYLLHTTKVSDGYTALWQRDCLDHTVERLILQPEWQDLFTDEEHRIAVKRLREYGYSGPLPDVTQS